MDITLKEYLSISTYDSVNECDITYDLAIGGYDDTETEYLELNEKTKKYYGDNVIYSLDIFNVDEKTLHIRIELTNRAKGQ